MDACLPDESEAQFFSGRLAAGIAAGEAHLALALAPDAQLAYELAAVIATVQRRHRRVFVAAWRLDRLLVGHDHGRL